MEILEATVGEEFITLNDLNMYIREYQRAKQMNYDEFIESRKQRKQDKREKINEDLRRYSDVVAKLEEEDRLAAEKREALSSLQSSTQFSIDKRETVDNEPSDDSESHLEVLLNVKESLDSMQPDIDFLKTPLTDLEAESFSKNAEDKDETDVTVKASSQELNALFLGETDSLIGDVEQIKVCFFFIYSLSL